MSSSDLRRINKIEVPFVVVLGERPVKLSEILAWIPGSIIELGKDAEDELDIRINNKQIGSGTAVKVGENFGVQINYCGEPQHRIEAMGPDAATATEEHQDAEPVAAAQLDDEV